MTVLLGCIADDFTGATDLANMLVRGGMRTIMTIDVPRGRLPPDADAVVITLKSRTIAAADAVRQSLAALDALRGAGCRQVFFKYCSTFDSTDKGNIGPVAEALMAALGTGFTIACPAFPEAGRTICRGYLFVGDGLLSESGMERHPLTPMTDSNLVRVLQRQSQARVGLVRYDAVAKGPAAIRRAFGDLKAQGCRLAIVDALSNADLVTIGAACADHALITGGSGVALGLPENFRQSGLLTFAGAAADLPTIAGPAAVIAGSCSRATNAQVAEWPRQRPAFRIDPLALAAGEDVAGAARDFAAAQLTRGPVLIYATAEPEAVAAVQRRLGAERAGSMIEAALAAIARDLAAQGVRRLVVAGGETAGAVVKALGIEGLRIGPQIDPGVPWTASLGPRPIALALKSGNFGTPDFFMKALTMLDVAPARQEARV